MALLPGSPAIDAGNNALIPGGVTTDQRGELPAHRQRDRGHRRLRVEWVHHRRHFGQRAVGHHRPSLRRSPGRDGHRQQRERAGRGRPGHVHRPASGASASPSVNPATIAANGTASTTPTANASAGSYTVTATASGRDQHPPPSRSPTSRRLAGRQHDQRLRQPWPGSQHPPTWRSPTPTTSPRAPR